MILWTFFQMIFLDTKNVICPMPSAPQVFPISIRTVLSVINPETTIGLRVANQLSNLVNKRGAHSRLKSGMTNSVQGWLC